MKAEDRAKLLQAIYEKSLAGKISWNPAGDKKCVATVGNMALTIEGVQVASNAVRMDLTIGTVNPQKRLIILSNEGLGDVVPNVWKKLDEILQLGLRGFVPDAKAAELIAAIDKL